MAYDTDIPADAVEHVTDRHPDGSRHVAEYLVDGEVVGRRQFDAAGWLCLEIPLRAGQAHGTEYRFDDAGVLTSAIPFEDGLEHGTARQFREDGSILGTYDMDRGTGWDLWWSEDEEGEAFLAEARFWRDGTVQGAEWNWASSDWMWKEQGFVDGQRHGIEREWAESGKLEPGFPRFWVNEAQVSRRRYAAAVAEDPTLTPWRKQDDRPARAFPEPVARALAG